MFRSIQSGHKEATPYVKKYVPTLDVPKSDVALDFGSGNGRNIDFIKSLGFKKVLGFDKAESCCDIHPDVFNADLGKDEVPLPNTSAGLILCNYLMCFLNVKQRKHLASQIDRVGKQGCYLVMELYPAKTAYEYSTSGIRDLFPNWETVHIVKDRFILRKLS